MKVTFPAKRQSATVTLSFDFTSLMTVGSILSVNAVGVTVYSGVDPTPAGILSGSPAINGNVVAQSVIAGVPGTIYSLICSVNTSDGQVLELQGFLAISQNAV